MVDFLSVECPDPFGQVITGGMVAKVDHDRKLEWSTFCRRNVAGSWSSQMTVRNLMADEVIVPLVRRRSGLELSGNPAKFLQGHNLFGSDDVCGVLRATVEKVADSLGLPMSSVDYGQSKLSRIDLTGSWLLPRAEDVLPFLRAMEATVWCPYRGRGVQDDNLGTLYYGKSEKGKRAKDWQLKLYHKGREITVHKLPEPAYYVPGLLEEVNRTVRVELTLRTAELKRLGLRRVSDWTPEKVATVWRTYVDRLDFSEATMRLDSTDLAGTVKPRILDAVSSWKAGNDMRIGRCKSGFYKLRKEVREATGIDIATAVPRSNVVALRRIIEAVPAGRPAWADALTQALAA
jgi:II/X family phage/plasmid replication protein